MAHRRSLRSAQALRLRFAIELRSASLRMTALSGAWNPAVGGSSRSLISLHGKDNSGKGFAPSCSTHVVPRLRRRKHGAPVLGDRGVQNPRLQPRDGQRRSLDNSDSRSASPDFLSRVAASVGCVWFSLKRTASGIADESSAAGNPASLGMTKGEGRSKERAVAEPRHLSKQIWTGLKFSRPCGTELGSGFHTPPSNLMNRSPASTGFSDLACSSHRTCFDDES
jgi:hypothetical protein